jgi:hypothetical protein
MVGNGWRWGVGTLNDAQIQLHAIHFKKTIEFRVTTPILCLEHIVGLMNPKMAQLFMDMSYKTSMLLSTKHYPYYEFVHTCRKELLSHLNQLAVYTTQSQYVGVHLIKISHVYKYAIT